MMQNQSRRQFLKCSAAAGLGSYPALSWAAEINQGRVLAPTPSHFPAKAKHLIVIFLTGGFSHVDTFDPKPKLPTDHRRTLFDHESPHAHHNAVHLLGTPFHISLYVRASLSLTQLVPLQ